VPAVTAHVTPTVTPDVGPVTATTTTSEQPPAAVPPPPLELDAAAVAAAAPGVAAGELGAPPAREAAVGQVVDLVLSMWRNALDDVEARTGKRMFSDEFLDKMWRPSAMRLGIKYLPNVDNDITDAVTVTVPMASTFYVARKLAKLPARKRDDAPAAPVGAEPPPPPKPPEPPAAPVPPPAKDAVY